MSERIKIGGLRIHNSLYELVEKEIAPGTGVDSQTFWTSLGEIVSELTPINKSLLKKRDTFQEQIDQWHSDNPDASLPNNDYLEFLKSIGYLLPEGEDFTIETGNVDPEVLAEILGG